MIQSIDTFYNGNYFRSRMEARWAVFFEVSMIEYQYEPEGFILEDGQRYLPDFYLPQFSCYAEVKPNDCYAYDAWGRPQRNSIEQHRDYFKWLKFTKEKNLIILFGNPHNKCFFKMSPQDDKNGYHDTVGFYNKRDEWFFWIAAGDEEFNELDTSVEIALRKRFEHNQ